MHICYQAKKYRLLLIWKMRYLWSYVYYFRMR